MGFVFFPEGKLFGTAANDSYLSSIDKLKAAQLRGITLEAVAGKCDSMHNLILDLGCGLGVIPRYEAALGIGEDGMKDIAIISRVGKPVCFKVLCADKSLILLSRRLAQEEAMSFLIDTLYPGDVLPATVTRLEPFGAFVDLACGLTAMIAMENISVARIRHPSERFRTGQDIFVAVQAIDALNRRVYTSHKELLGTWEENAAEFGEGETVVGVVRSVKPYGTFIELTPNLSGLTENRDDLSAGECVSVYIRAIIPEKMKIKLAVIDKINCSQAPKPQLKYYISGGRIRRWRYSPAGCEKIIETAF